MDFHQSDPDSYQLYNDTDLDQQDIAHVPQPDVSDPPATSPIVHPITPIPPPIVKPTTRKRNNGPIIQKKTPSTKEKNVLLRAKRKYQHHHPDVFLDPTLSAKQPPKLKADHIKKLADRKLLDLTQLQNIPTRITGPETDFIAERHEADDITISSVNSSSPRAPLLSTKSFVYSGMKPLIV